MLFRAPVIVLAALLAQSALAADNICPAGKYLKKNPGGPLSGYTCTVCPSGQYTSTQSAATACLNCPAGQGNNSDHTGCVPCANGTYSGLGTGCTNCAAGNTSNPSHTGCTPCLGNTYSPGGTPCMLCPAGQQVKPNQTGCDKCTPGKFNPTAGSVCQNCPAGKFNNVQGAKACCDCCAGYYSASRGSTSCSRCRDLPGPYIPYGPVGASASNQCSSNQAMYGNYATSCSQTANNACPATKPGGPVGSVITRKRGMTCTKGFTSCPRYSGRGGFDCVDTENDPESCGGCVGLDGSGSGTDCTAIHGNSVTRCVKGSCVIDSCRKGWVKSLDGSECVLASRATGSPASDGLHAQDAKKAKRGSAKRAIRYNIF